ncbi:ribokinase [Scopulibacillus darangshiensis]|nr:ribokinase [Scopulibacillus darangshiensis]
MNEPVITVIGSINMDLVTESDMRPKAGETLLGSHFSMIPGGKGANQAVAAARLGAKVNMIGCVGDDLFGEQLTANLKKEGIAADYVEPVTHQQTGIAAITLAEGDNSIIVVPGANHDLSADHISKFEALIAESDVVLLQLEIPLEAVVKAAELAKKHRVKVVLNPAPIQGLPDQLINSADLITPNEHEYDQLKRDYQGDLQVLKNKLVVTKGGAGTAIFKNGKETIVPGYAISVVDTTGAGDAFNGALAVQVAKGASLEEACRSANAVGALAVTKLGAQSGMPTADEVEAFLKKGV